MFKYNKGEWSEIYTFTYLLSTGVLHSADKDLNVLEDVYYPIIKILREEEKNNIIEYYTGDKIRIYRNNELLGEIDKEEFTNITDYLLEEIPEGKKAFEIPRAEVFLRSVFVGKIKAASNAKEDITLQLQDIHTGIQPICGFSIKSFLGARPTLVNPGVNTNFVYEIENCNDDIMNTVNSIDTRTKIKDRIKKILDSNCTIRPIEHSISATFEENLCYVDWNMPLLLQHLLLTSYVLDDTSVAAAVRVVMEQNPLQARTTEIYRYKFKKMLCAFALGMTPEREDWLGAEDANGGYITVRSDGKIVCYHIYNRTEFEEYLLNYTFFDRPSTSRYNYCNIYKEDNKYKIKLCLQIRFKNIKNG